MIAHSPKDVELGLVTNQDLYAVDEFGEPLEFNLASGSKMDFQVVFVGDFAGTKQKSDRNLPNIEIVEVR